MKRFVIGSLAVCGLWTASWVEGQVIPNELLTEARASALATSPEVLRQRLGDLLTECENAPDDGGGREGADDVTCLLLEGLVHSFSAEHELGRLRFAAALEGLENRDDPLGVALVHLLMAEAERQQGAFERAGDLYRRGFVALESARSSSAPIQLDTFELFFRLQGVPAGAIDQFRQVAQLVRPMITAGFEVAMRMGYAMWLGQAGTLDSAIEQLERALELSRVHLLSLGDADVLNELSRWHLAAEHFEEVRTLAAGGVAAADRSGQSEIVYSLLWRKAQAELALGLPREAVATGERIRDRARLAGDGAKEGEALSDLAEALALAGDVERARTTFDEAWGAARRADSAWTSLLVAVRAGSFYLQLGEYERSVGFLEEALKVPSGWERQPREAMVALRINVYLLLSEVYHLLGRSQLMAEKVDAAQALLQTVDIPEAEALA
ncbi:MAG: hypothetical protein AAFY88_04215, partial [Acidobacteriota bacterium]